MTTDAPITEIKLTNRRRMAWQSSIQTALFVFAFTLAAFLVPNVSSVLIALIPALPILLVFLSWPQLAYFTSSALIDRIIGKVMGRNISASTSETAGLEISGGIQVRGQSGD